MAEVQGQADIDKKQGIKLFGATIILTVQEKKSDGDEKSNGKNGDDDDHNRPEKIIPCPRCKSMETKFCYFNNYNVNQPRHFCKGCQRYWTAGGALRNVPVGAGRRKNKPPCRGLSEGCLFGGAAAASGLMLHRLDGYDGVVEEWNAAERGGFRWNILPAKRRRNISAGQPC